MKKLLYKMLSSQDDKVVRAALYECKIESEQICLPNGWRIRAIDNDNSITRTTIRMGPGDGNVWSMYRNYHSFMSLAQANQTEEAQQ